MYFNNKNQSVGTFRLLKFLRSLKRQLQNSVNKCLQLKFVLTTRVKQLALFSTRCIPLQSLHFTQSLPRVCLWPCQSAILKVWKCSDCRSLPALINFSSFLKKGWVAILCSITEAECEPSWRVPKTKILQMVSADWTRQHYTTTRSNQAIWLVNKKFRTCSNQHDSTPDSLLKILLRQVCDNSVSISMAT